MAWASINLGLCMCIECSGVHRSLGVHVSIVRSLKLDRMDHSVHRLMASVGNQRANAVWEAHVPQNWAALKPGPTAEMAERARWIRAKYDQRVRIAIVLSRFSLHFLDPVSMHHRRAPHQYHSRAVHIRFLDAVICVAARRGRSRVCFARAVPRGRGRQCEWNSTMLSEWFCRCKLGQCCRAATHCCACGVCCRARSRT